ncbi:MAG TPA: hypothetical protein VNN10_16295 [Dehalococcoidia bacterium]|nr:hypothetical protein [Dehalococcoidia bacterium]
MQEFDDTDLEAFAVDGFTLPLLNLNDVDLPMTLIRVGGRDYQYDRSYPHKGYGAIMPAYVAEQVAAGRKPLVVERGDRYYLYFEVAPAA